MPVALYLSFLLLLYSYYLAAITPEFESMQIHDISRAICLGGFVSLPNMTNRVLVLLMFLLIIL